MFGCPPWKLTYSRLLKTCVKLVDCADIELREIVRAPCSKCSIGHIMGLDQHGCKLICDTEAIILVVYITHSWLGHFWQAIAATWTASSTFKVSNQIRAQATEPTPDELAVILNHRLLCSIQSSHIHPQYTVYHLCDAPHLLSILSLKIWTAGLALHIEMYARHVRWVKWWKPQGHFVVLPLLAM